MIDTDKNRDDWTKESKMFFPISLNGTLHNIV